MMALMSVSHNSPIIKALWHNYLRRRNPLGWMRKKSVVFVRSWKNLSLSHQVTWVHSFCLQLELHRWSIPNSILTALHLKKKKKNPVTTGDVGDVRTHHHGNSAQKFGASILIVTTSNQILSFQHCITLLWSADKYICVDHRLWPCGGVMAVSHHSTPGVWALTSWSCVLRLWRSMAF